MVSHRSVFSDDIILSWKMFAQNRSDVEHPSAIQLLLSHLVNIDVVTGLKPGSCQFHVFYIYL